MADSPNSSARSRPNRASPISLGRAPSGLDLARRYSGPTRAAAIKRRAVSIPSSLALFVLLPLISPVLVPGLVLVDLVRARPRLPLVRIAAMLWCWLACDLVAVVTAAGLWLATGFGLGLGTRWSRRAHGTVQAWFIATVAKAAERTVNLHFEVEHVDALRPGPLIVLSRHTSYGDAILPALLLGSHEGLGLRYSLTKEMAWDPALDLYAHRLPDHFINRTATPEEAAAEHQAMTDLATGMERDEVAVVFPEGRFYTPERAQRARESIARTDPERAERVGRLRHLMPLRPGGTLRFLEASPDTDVLIIAHVGLEGFTNIAEILRNVPLRRTVVVRTHRIGSAQIPVGEEERIRWMDETWQSVDDWIDAELKRS